MRTWCDLAITELGLPTLIASGHLATKIDPHSWEKGSTIRLPRKQQKSDKGKIPVHMGKEPVFLWIIDAYSEHKIIFRVYISVSVP